MHLSKVPKLTEFQARALSLINAKGPLIASDVGEALWPDRRFKNAQGAAYAGGGAMGSAVCGIRVPRTFGGMASGSHMVPFARQFSATVKETSCNWPI